jgi:hypothetical protein
MAIGRGAPRILVLAHDRRRIGHFGVTAHPAAEWAAQQLRDALPWDTAPRFHSAPEQQLSETARRSRWTTFIFDRGTGHFPDGRHIPKARFAFEARRVYRFLRLPRQLGIHKHCLPVLV